MERTKLGLSKDKMYKALGEGERTSKKVASIRMSDGSTFKRKNANQYGTAEGGNDYTEKRSNRTDRFDLGGTADSSNTGANMGGTMGSSIMKNGGSTIKDNRMNERTRAVILKIQKTGIHPDDVSPNFVAEIAYENGIKLKSEEIVFISDNYAKKISKHANGGGLANTPESFPSNDAISYKTGGKIKKITEWSISTDNEEEHFDNYKDAKDFWNNLDKKEKESGQFFKKSYVNGEEDDVEILDGKLSGYAQGGSTKGFEYTIGGL